MEQCRGKTDDGRRCKRTVRDGYYCRDHGLHGSGRPDEMDKNGRMTLSALARFIGRSPGRMTQYKNKGIIELEADGKVDVEKALDSLVKHTDTTRSDLPFKLYEASTGPKPVEESDEDARLKRQQLVAEVQYKEARAHLMRLKCEKRADSLVSADEASALFRYCRRLIRDRLMDLPAEMSPVVQDMSDDREVYEYLRTMIRETLTELADEIEALAEQRPAAA